MQSLHAKYESLTLMKRKTYEISSKTIVSRLFKS